MTNIIKNTMKSSNTPNNNAISSIFFTILSIIIIIWAVPHIAYFFSIPFQTYMIYLYWIISLIIFQAVLPSIEEDIFFKVANKK